VPPSAPSAPPPARLRRAPAALWREGAFGVVVLGPGRDEPHTLTGTGPALWDALAEPRTRDELATTLAARFGADRGRVAAALAAVIEALLQLGVIDETP
jgi:Coenzyme PQQ synthesis protein D (PqqD)